MPPHTVTKAVAHLMQDPDLGPYVARLPRPATAGTKAERNLTQADPFQALVRSIIYQQLSGKAAGTILGRFVSHFRGGVVTPKKLLTLTDEQFKQTGVSGQKMSYLRDLADKFLDGTIDPTHFDIMTDEDIRTHLIAVKGIGRWTADMFLMFTLYRPDVLPTGDLAIQKGFQKVFGLKKLPDVKKMEKLAEPWRPYRTVACHYLWRTLDTEESNW